MTIKEPASTSPPDWETLSEEIHCPLCDYNLRGLVEPRCPECGFKFDWKELLESTRNVHPYLFEHQPKRNIWSFWKTFWRDCRPRRFWREVHPGHVLKPRRLMLYWVLANAVLMFVVVVPFIDSAVRMATAPSPVAHTGWTWAPGHPTTAEHLKQFSSINQIPIKSLIPDTYTPAPPPKLWTPYGLQMAWACAEWDRVSAGALSIFIVWPWLTLSALLIFQASMQQVKIRQAHVLRCVIYSCDFPLLLIIASAIAPDPTPLRYPTANSIITLVCFGVTLYRLSTAYKRYMRFDRPFLTVLSSQIIVGLAVFTVIVNMSSWWWRW
jgi:hypothetical protein